MHDAATSRQRLGGLLFLAAAGCTWPISEPPGWDAGLDAHVRPDAGSDAALDASSDSRLDAPWPEDDPGWVHSGAVTNDCDVDVATFPERVFPRTTWEPDCGVGCRRFASSLYLTYAGDSDGVAVIVTQAETEDGAVDPQRTMVFSELETGRALLALRDRRNARTPLSEPICILGTFATAVGGGSLAVSASFLRFDPTGRFVWDEWMSVLRADRLGAEPLRAMAQLDGWDSPRELRVSATHVGARFRWGPLLVRNDGTHAVPTYGLGMSEQTEHLAIWGENDLFWEAQREPTVLLRSANGAPPVVVRSVEGGDVRGFDSDGTDFAWLEARAWDGVAHYGSVSLWTATYNGLRLASPRQVAVVQGHEDGAVGGGYYVHVEPGAAHSVFAFYRLSDGARATFDTGNAAAAVLWVSAEDSVVQAFGETFRIDPRTLRFE